MDPFSIAGGCITIADLGVRLAKFIREVNSGFEQTEVELSDLRAEIEGLIRNCDWIREIFEPSTRGATHQAPVTGSHSDRIVIELEACQAVLEDLHALLKGVVGGTEKLDRLEKFRRWRRQQKKDDELQRLRNNLRVRQNALSFALNALNAVNVVSPGRPSNHLERSESLHNEHFIAQAVSSTYTGRSKHHNLLKRWLFDEPVQSTLQKRFVICGPPGSGKTEFCCKFASDNKHKFWGVFWIDASSQELAKQSFRNLATIGKVGRNETAVKSWLSSQDRPWLLVLDNVDEQNFPISKYYPDGANGVVIITTRNWTLKIEGTVGDKYFEFLRLDEHESVELLLTAAGESSREDSVLAKAAELCRRLDYLPLALTLAGKTLLSRTWDIDDYLRYYEDNQAQSTDVETTRASHTEANGEDDEEDATISHTYELLRDGLVSKGTRASQDALDLHHIMAFLHPRMIRRSFFLRAATNPALEAQAEKQRLLEASGAEFRLKPREPWLKLFRNTVVDAVGLLARLGSRPALPPFFKDGSTQEANTRIKDAFKELYNVSLIFGSTRPADGYSMHPAVHELIINRLSKTTAEKAVWCRIAATILAQAVLLPPLDEDDGNQILKRDLLPHVQRVEAIEAQIAVQIATNLEGRARRFPNLAPRLDRNRAQQLVRFSQVYKQGGMLDQAEKHLRDVRNMVQSLLGQDHHITLGLTLLLADTYWHQTRGEDAAVLLKDAMDACQASRGPSDYWTLRLHDAYAGSLWFQGLIPQALEASRVAVEGLTAIRGPNHPDTLRALSSYARVVGKNFEFSEAIDMNDRALTGLQTKLGRHHLDTLTAQDNLAMSYFDRAAHGFGRDGDLDRALAYEQDAFERRTNRLGRDHYVTLWSGLNLSRIKGLRGDIGEALSLWEANHAIAEPLLGKTHFGVLLGRLHHARILMYAKRFGEAESEARFVVDTYPRQRKTHPDRLMALFTLIKCRYVLGDSVSVLKPMVDELVQGAKALFGVEHKWIQYLANPLSVSETTTSDMLLPAQSTRRNSETLLIEQQQTLSLYGSIRTPSPLPTSRSAAQTAG